MPHVGLRRLLQEPSIVLKGKFASQVISGVVQALRFIRLWRCVRFFAIMATAEKGQLLGDLLNKYSNFKIIYGMREKRRLS